MTIHHKIRIFVLFLLYNITEATIKNKQHNEVWRLHVAHIIYILIHLTAISTCFESLRLCVQMNRILLWLVACAAHRKGKHSTLSTLNILSIYSLRIGRILIFFVRKCCGGTFVVHFFQQHVRSRTKLV